MGRTELKPGEHGSISIKQTGPKTWRARTRLKLLTEEIVPVSRNASREDEARLKVQAAVAELLTAGRGSDELKPDSKVGLACRQWITEMRVRSTWPRPPMRTQTIDKYEYQLDRYAVPVLGNRRLNELTPALCQRLIDSVVARGMPGENDMTTTAVRIRSVLNMVLDRAVIHDAIRDNPMRKTITPDLKQPVPRAITATDVYRLRKAVRKWVEGGKDRPGPDPSRNLAVVIDVLLGTGARIGEALALRWDEVDLDSADGVPTVTIAATMVSVRGQGCVRQGIPKTDAGERVITLPPFVVESLRTIQPATVTAAMPVFPSRRYRDDGTVLRCQAPSNLRRQLRAALAAADMTGEVHPHLLRSTVATFVARKRGVAEAAALLGHKIQAGVTGRSYIERLRHAPDVSAVLQAMVDIGEQEGRLREQGQGTESDGASGNDRSDARAEVQAA
ncbi:tyrosine-type recombinase/integrase [Promicromonospora sp. NPDC050249]|uniref:tyrosine-type recombinase/integrase n=1 Tax=Promicromonospora sp. NPDC050249 TaxID=3154743 RepID=UPI0033D505EE